MPTKIRRNSLPRISLKSCQSAMSRLSLSSQVVGERHHSVEPVPPAYRRAIPSPSPHREQLDHQRSPMIATRDRGGGPAQRGCGLAKHVFHRL